MKDHSTSRGMRLITGTAAAALALTGIAVLHTATAAPASAYVCGYSVENEDYKSLWSVDLPIVGTVDPFGGTRQVAHYGNCTKSKQRISVKTASGKKSYCVSPGDTRLGFTQNGSKVSGAVKTGTC
ncbi:DUF6355 family natural product biosynthesis protein [Clavibacter zhangzhiyongii]|jgi:hypothetical protein|uniref:DUF6355 family natural product biosynthesis protein n=1 Tax=Clavibacter zhangzhiyongii TaxID=2768071 RepID=UPI00195A7AE4|nr:DUF6355 family natural product biosynthesis protein [Clavibacter zhangzhiyongii]MBM7025963.1 hypothetical protein [Clavibacter zhangzhiyongii]